jgi:hypothetical protein
MAMVMVMMQSRVTRKGGDADGDEDGDDYDDYRPNDDYFF